jgi:hypothetical protein
VKTGDDASCLNLNRVETPEILGIDPDLLQGRFSFSRTLEGSRAEDGWGLLEIPLEEGTVPAVADQTVITWGLGKKVGDELVYTDEIGEELRLKLVAGLDDSVFQGKVIISEEAFIRHFPSIGGRRLFLIDTPADAPAEHTTTLEKDLIRSMADTGLQIQSTGERLAAFYSVQNTYLSIFLVLGGFGLLLGTVGLGIIVIRNVNDSRGEIALLRAVGYQQPLISGILVSEHLPAVFFGVLWGTISALTAVYPILKSGSLSGLTAWLFMFPGLLVILSVLWILLTAKFSIKKDFLPALRQE